MLLRLTDIYVHIHFRKYSSENGNCKKYIVSTSYRPGFVVNKGQLISEGNFGAFKSPKKQTFKIKKRISALASKMGLLKKALYYII